MNDALKTSNFAGLYMRLSKEDAQKEESASIENQRKILRHFANENGFFIYDEYTDDGFSGTTMKRPEFKRMLTDIKNGRIGIVITKDFSRLGRNTGQVMTMLDDYFSRYNVRYIAISEGIDTKKSEYFGILTPMLSFTNEMYSGDISRKINASFKIKMENGEFIGAFAPFGYAKNPENKNKLIIDEVSSEIVREIFHLAKNDHTPKQIADILNKKCVPTPSKYRSFKNPHLCSCTVSKEWSAGSVGKILRNEVYLGHTIQGKTHKKSFKSSYIKNIPKAEWKRVLSTHEALITDEDWDIVRKKLKNRTSGRKNGFLNIFSGLAKCSDCAKNMSTTGTRRKGSKANLICGAYKQNGNSACKNHTICYETLYCAVLEALKKEISLSCFDKEDALKRLITVLSPDAARSDELLKKQEKISFMLTNLIDMKLSGSIDDKAFEFLENKYKTEISKIDTHLMQDKKNNQNTSLGQMVNDFKELIPEIENPKTLDKDILFQLIDKIDVHQGKYENGSRISEIDIYFKFKCESRTFTV